MHTLLQKLFFISLIVAGPFIFPLHAQQTTGKQDTDQSFIKQGIFLTGFSLSFSNASRNSFNQEFARESTHILAQLDGLYFISNRFGLGPLLGYRFTYRDLEDPFRDPSQPDSDTRNGQFVFGIKGGWYIPAANILGGTGDTQFFVDGGLSLMRNNFKKENKKNRDANYQFGFQIGTGFLFPVGKRIALETKLGFQAHRKEYNVNEFNSERDVITHKENKWLKEVAFSAGLKVTF